MSGGAVTTLEQVTSQRPGTACYDPVVMPRRIATSGNRRTR
jgi:hypothetical protein